MAASPVLIEDMTRKEIVERLGSVRVVIVPVASTEQHGQHLPLKHDTIQCMRMAEEAARRLCPEVLITPSVSIGLSAHHLSWPLSLTLQPETFINLIFDICSSLKHHGIERVVVLNGHGGNRNPVLWGGTGSPPIRLAAERAQKLGLRVTSLNWWDLVRPSRASEIIGVLYPGHSGETETSLALYLYPEQVRANELVPCVGISADVEAASLRKGKILFEEVVENLVSFLTDYRNDRIDTPYYQPHVEKQYTP